MEKIYRNKDGLYVNDYATNDYVNGIVYKNKHTQDYNHYTVLQYETAHKAKQERKADTIAYIAIFIACAVLLAGEIIKNYLNI